MIKFWWKIKGPCSVHLRFINARACPEARVRYQVERSRGGPSRGRLPSNQAAQSRHFGSPQQADFQVNFRLQEEAGQVLPPRHETQKHFRRLDAIAQASQQHAAVKRS